MASSLAIYYTPMHFMWGVKSGATPAIIGSKAVSAILRQTGNTSKCPFCRLIEQRNNKEI